MLRVAGTGCQAGVPLIIGSPLPAVLAAAYSPSRGGCWPWCTATSAALTAQRAWAATGLAVRRRRTRTKYPPARLRAGLATGVRLETEPGRLSVGI